MKIAAAVILYNPEKAIVNNIASYSIVADEILVIDNSESTGNGVAAWLAEMPGVTLQQDGKNLGIAVRLNAAADYFSAKGFDWLLTMDQDSRFSTEQVLAYRQCVQSFPTKEQCAMFGVNYETNKSGDICNAKKVEQLITSGSLLNLSLFNRAGRFDEALFIDEVDLDFCYQAIVAGFDIIQLENIHLEHQLGTTSQHRSLKTGKLSDRTLHSPFRLYYMVRNFFFVNAKYPGRFMEDKARRKAALLNRIKNNLLYNGRRMRVLKAIFAGYRDYQRKKMGKQH